MISIFNGRERKLGGSTSEIFAQINVEFRQHLHVLKGAKLAVFLAISLHANQHGWAWPSRKRLSQETGYNERTVSDALTELCKDKINGQRLLLRYQPKKNGSFENNHYLIFPSPAEVTQFEGSQMELPCEGFLRAEKPHAENLRAENLHAENPLTKKNHPKEETDGKEETEKKKEEPTIVICSIHNKPMQLCQANDGSGDQWYAHRQAGVWCKGAPGDQPAKPVDVRDRYLAGEYAEFIQH